MNPEHDAQKDVTEAQATSVNDANTFQPETETLKSSEPIQQPAVKPKKRSTLPTTIAFLLGATIFALFSAGYNFYTQASRQLSESRVSSEESAEVLNIPTTPAEPEAISEDALSKYVDVTNCTEKKEYLSYDLAIEKGSLNEIDLYDGAKVAVKSGNTTRTAQLLWGKLPAVVDYKCDKISITEITTDDRLNVYVDKGSVNPASVTAQPIQAKILQKANK